MSWVAGLATAHGAVLACGFVTYAVAHLGAEPDRIAAVAVAAVASVHTTLNALSLAVILHVAVWRRRPAGSAP